MRHLCRREATPMALHGERGIFSHVREYPPWTPRRTRGENPSTPDIGSLDFEELHTLRNRVRCTWLRHESSAIRYQSQPRLTIVRRE